MFTDAGAVLSAFMLAFLLTSLPVPGIAGEPGELRAHTYESNRVEQMARKGARHRGRVLYISGCSNVVIDEDNRARRVYLAVDGREDDCRGNYGNVVIDSARVRQLNTTVQAEGQHVNRVGNVTVLDSGYSTDIVNRVQVQGNINTRDELSIGTVYVQESNDGVLRIYNETLIDGVIEAYD